MGPSVPQPPRHRFAFAWLAYTVGFLGFLSWGWIAAAVFLLLGGGLRHPTDVPVLSFMLPWGTPLFAFGLVAALLAGTLDRARCRSAPWRWMLAVQLSSLVPYFVGLLWFVFVG